MQKRVNGFAVITAIIIPLIGIGMHFWSSLLSSQILADAEKGPTIIQAEFKNNSLHSKSSVVKEGTCDLDIGKIFFLCYGICQERFDILLIASEKVFKKVLEKWKQKSKEVNRKKISEKSEYSEVLKKKSEYERAKENIEKILSKTSEKNSSKNKE